MYQKKPVLFQLQHYICPQNAKNFGKNNDLRKEHTFQLVIHHHHQLNLSEHDLLKLNMNEHGRCNHSHIHTSTNSTEKASHALLYTHWQSGRAEWENIWLKVMMYGLSATRSMPHDWKLNFFLSGATKLSQ